MAKKADRKQTLETLKEVWSDSNDEKEMNRLKIIWGKFIRFMEQ